MDNNTHEPGKMATMREFLEAMLDACDHDYNGPSVSFNDKGEYFKDADMPDYKTDPEGWLEFQKVHEISGGCVTCSKCGKPFEPPMW